MSHIEQHVETFDDEWYDDDHATYRDEQDRHFRELAQLKPIISKWFSWEEEWRLREELSSNK